LGISRDFFKFREAVNHIPNVYKRNLVQLLYLTAANPSEICTRTTPSELKNQATKPYGKFMQWQLGKFTKKNDVLLIKVSLTRASQSSPAYKLIALPVHTSFEPWTADLLKRIAGNKKLEFDLTRVSVNKIVRESLASLLGREIRAKDLRQTRLEHLAKLYGFDPYDLAAVAGKVVHRNLIMVEQTPEGMEEMLELAWRRYFPKLQVPIRDLVM